MSLRLQSSQSRPDELCGGRRTWYCLGGEQRNEPAPGHGNGAKILLVEIRSPNINWTEPRDFTVAEALADLQSMAAGRSGPTHHSAGSGVPVRGVVLTDRRVAMLPQSLSPQIYEKLITQDDSELEANALFIVPKPPGPDYRLLAIVSFGLSVMGMFVHGYIGDRRSGVTSSHS